MPAGLACLPAWAVFATAALSRASARQFVSLSCAVPLHRLKSISMHVRGVFQQAAEQQARCGSHCRRPCARSLHTLCSPTFSSMFTARSHTARTPCRCSYLEGLAEAVVRHGGKIYEGTKSWKAGKSERPAQPLLMRCPAGALSRTPCCIEGPKRYVRLERLCMPIALLCLSRGRPCGNSRRAHHQVRLRQGFPLE